MLLNKLWRLLDSANSHYEKFADGTVKCIDDEIPFEIPQSWCWVRFGSLVIHNPQVTADDETNAAFMPMTLIDAGYGSSYTYETQKWGTIKTGFTKIATGDIAYAKITPCFQNRKSFILGETSFDSSPFLGFVCVTTSIACVY